MSSSSNDNPFFMPWVLPHAAPPFDLFKPAHFRPAFAHGLAEHKAEIETIAAASTSPTFETIILAMERAGLFLDRVANIFYNLVATDGTAEWQEIEREMAPLLAAHHADIFTNDRLFTGVQALYADRDQLGLDEEQKRLLSRIYDAFKRAGAHLNAQDRAYLKEIAEKLASLSTQFAQNVLKDEADYLYLLQGEAELAGLPESVRVACAQLATSRGHEGEYAVSLSRSSVEPVLTYAKNRELRQKLWAAWTSRGEAKALTDNRPLIAQIVALRAERARLLGFSSFAHYKLADTMAETPEAVRTLLDRVWPAARAKAAGEASRLQELISGEGHNFELAAHDWRYYAEKLRKVEYDFDESELRPYFTLDRMIQAAFDTAHRLFSIQFKERFDLPVYHPSVRVFEVCDSAGQVIALFYGDYYARPTKRGGAWMSAFRSQQKLDGRIIPIIVNVMNLTESVAGMPVLLSLDDARTLFHEFGHALHGMLSDVTYPWLSGTAVSTDFVELPSQLYEHWFLEPAVLSRFALHHETHAPLSDAIIDKIVKARTFNQGFLSVEYCASALVDLELHLLPLDQVPLDITAFEAKILQKIQMPMEINMRHRPPHFTHIFCNEGYASGYYSYIWSEVLDADAFEAFCEAGDVFDPAVAARLKTYIYAAGNRRPPLEAYIAFRGRAPEVEPLLRKRGLIAKVD